VQHERESANGAPLIRDRYGHRLWNGPGSATHHSALARFV